MPIGVLPADLSDDERSALAAYKSASPIEEGSPLSHCFDLNRDLRHGIRLDEIHEKLRRNAEFLDSIFCRVAPLEEEITVFRAEGKRGHWPLHDFGKCFRTLNYWSTARSEGATEAFLRSEGVTFELRLSVGIPVIDMEKVEGFGAHEEELLLPRGVLWKVDNTICPDPNKNPKLFQNVARAQLRAIKWSLA